MISLRKLVFGALVSGAILTAGAITPASASVVTFDLTVDTCTGTCGTGPFGTVTVTDLGVGLGVSVDVSLATGVNFLQDALFFSLSGHPNLTTTGFVTPFAPSDVTGLPAGNNFAGGSLGGFDYLVICTLHTASNLTGCGPGASNTNHGPLDFNITNSAVTTASFLSGLDNQGHNTNIFFVVDVQGANGNTGRIGAGPGHSTTGGCDLSPTDCQVPEPMSLSIFGAGLVGAASMWRRRRKASKAA